MTTAAPTNSIPGDTLRDPRMQWQRAMNRAAAANRAGAASPNASAADAANAANDSATPPPTFAERMRRVEVRGRSAAAIAADAESPTTTVAERERRVHVGRSAAAADPREAARTAAEQMVASLFVQPMLDMALKQDASGPFSPGQAEKSFGPLLNQRLADEIVRKSDLPLVQAIVDRMVAAPKPTLAAGAQADATAATEALATSTETDAPWQRSRLSSLSSPMTEPSDG